MSGASRWLDAVAASGPRPAKPTAASSPPVQARATAPCRLVGRERFISNYSLVLARAAVLRAADRAVRDSMSGPGCAVFGVTGLADCSVLDRWRPPRGRSRSDLGSRA